MSEDYKIEVGSLVIASWLTSVTGIVHEIKFCDVQCVPLYRVFWFSNLFVRSGNHFTEEYYEDIIRIEDARDWT